VLGHSVRVLADTPWARVLPKTIFAAAGVPLVSASERTINLEYEALLGMRVIASAPVSLTFGPADPKIGWHPLAPQVDSVVNGKTLRVTYDLTNIRSEWIHNPHLY